MNLMYVYSERFIDSKARRVFCCQIVWNVLNVESYLLYYHISFNANYELY